MREYFIWLAKVVTVFLIVVIGIPVIIGATIAAGRGIAQSEKKLAVNSHKKVAVVELIGVIEDTKEIIEDLYEDIDDPKIDGIVLRIDSPGGAVAPSQDLYNAIRKLKDKKPIVTSMGSLAASGGFYAAVAASKVLAQPGTMTGSVGVIMQIPNVSKITDMIGFDMITIRAGSMKDAGNSFRAMTEEERAYLQKTASTVHEQFIKDVANARGLTVEQVKAFADGRVILGEDAKALGVIDGFGDVHDAARLVLELKGEALKPDEMPELQYKDNAFKDFKKAFQSVSFLPKILTHRGAELRAELQ